MVTKTPYLVKKIYYSLIWDIKKEAKEVFLTFDDGPHPEITPAVIEILKKYNAKATFFSIGRNVERFHDVYTLISKNGHVCGNHTYSHLSGWKTKNSDYYSDIRIADNLIHSTLFRPPYGKIKRAQLKYLRNLYHIIMWDVMTSDFDLNLSPDKCLQKTLKSIRPGSIIVFHDSVKAYDRMIYALPRVIENIGEKGYEFKAIEKDFLPPIL